MLYTVENINLWRTASHRRLPAKGFSLRQEGQFMNYPYEWGDNCNGNHC